VALFPGPDSPAYRAWSAAADVVILNVLTLAGCLPVGAAGAARGPRMTGATAAGRVRSRTTSPQLVARGPLSCGCSPFSPLTASSDPLAVL